MAEEVPRENQTEEEEAGVEGLQVRHREPEVAAEEAEVPERRDLVGRAVVEVPYCVQIQREVEVGVGAPLGCDGQTEEGVEVEEAEGEVLMWGHGALGMVVVGEWATAQTLELEILAVAEVEAACDAM